MLLRGFLGGVRDPEVLTLSDEEMVETVKRDMQDVLGLRGQPVMSRVFRWPGGTPQLEVGHLERMARGRERGRLRPRPPPHRRRHPQHRDPRLRGRRHPRRRGRGGGRRGEARARSWLARPRPRAAAAPLAAAGSRPPGNGVAASVVYVQVFRSAFDWSQPWRQEGVSGASGSGFFIDGGRIMTNAHVIADARQILVRRPDQANPYVATRRGGGRTTATWPCSGSTTPPSRAGCGRWRFGPLPRAGTRVVTYGFPLGGQDVSSTAGIVSRVESRGYVHSGADAHLVVQTDAAINPGNSGGPVVQDGRVVGVAFQGFPGADNMGFFIPVPIVRHFLANLEDGRYDGFPDSGLETTPLLSPAYRRERGLPAGRERRRGGPRGSRRDGGRRPEAGRRAALRRGAARSRTTARSASATRA